MKYTETLKAQFDSFVQGVPAKRLKQNFIRVFYTYLEFSRKDGLPDYIDQFLPDSMQLLELLDAIDGEVNPS